MKSRPWRIMCYCLYSASSQHITLHSHLPYCRSYKREKFSSHFSLEEWDFLFLIPYCAGYGTPQLHCQGKNILLLHIGIVGLWDPEFHVKMVSTKSFSDTFIWFIHSLYKDMSNISLGDTLDQGDNPNFKRVILLFFQFFTGFTLKNLYLEVEIQSVTQKAVRCRRVFGLDWKPTPFGSFWTQIKSCQS